MFQILGLNDQHEGPVVLRVNLDTGQTWKLVKGKWVAIPIESSTSPQA